MEQLQKVYKACAALSQNSINNNIVELGSTDKLLDSKQLSKAIRSVSKFFDKINEAVWLRKLPALVSISSSSRLVAKHAALMPP
jgi:hypothetical protein